MQRTRKEILSILRTRGERTVRELANELGLTQMSVRLHLDILRRDALITSREVHQAVGRPYFAFCLTEKADELFPKAYLQLAEGLIDAAEARGGQAAVVALFDGVIDNMERKHASRLVGKSLDGRVRELVEILSEEGFMADARSLDDGFLLRTCNCPYGRVARSHPTLCRSECNFIARVLAADDGTITVERTDFRLAGDLHCSYRVRIAVAVPDTGIVAN